MTISSRRQAGQHLTPRALRSRFCYDIHPANRLFVISRRPGGSAKVGFRNYG
ncbi:hypothetical protein KCP77_10025 [Salmonella enterica subsp. enterica]|nr:hypothetical protein KCP77_10025 [Salmonella enterica subsp. enterica]